MTIKNLVFITIDCLRSDHLSCNGYTRLTSPYIDSLAREGVRFTHAITNGPTTASSFVSILTSTYPLMFGGYRTLSRNRTTVSTLLTRGGLTCAGFHSNPMLLSDYGYDQGFDLFVASGLKPAVPKWHQQPALFRGARGIARKVWQRFWRERTLWLPYTSAPALNRAAMAWLRQVKKPFFLWIHYMDVHNPYYPPPSHLERVTGHTISRRRMTYLARKEIHKKPMSASEIKDTIDLYDGCIAYVDSAVREIDSTLSELGLRDETVLIVTADHGEEFMEHGGTIHSAKMYDELLRVPLVIRAPGSPSGSVINEQVSLLGLSPTLLDLVGLPQFPGFVGHSLKPLLDEQVGEGDNLVFSHCYHQGGRVRFSASEGATLFALRTPEWKYIYDEESNQDELYDLKSDPNEQVNLVALEPEKRHWFRQALSRHIESLPGYKSERTPEIPQVEDDENILERLRALGYLD